MNYTQISKETFDLLYQSRASLSHSPLKAPMRVLAELRTSQINGCAYCCNLHMKEARSLGIAQEKLDVLAAWRNSTSFTEEERVVLEWAEALTYLEKDLKPAKDALFAIYSEREIVDLTAAIGLMNAFNRIAISLH